MAKPEYEFFPAKTVEFTRCAGAVESLVERVLASDPESGVATRILHMPPGTDTTPNGVQVHDFWEEVYILEGSFTDTRLGQTFSAGDFACRPPGMEHGPWTTEEGVTTFEVRYPA
ncbi:cupin domain-containing protein [Streptomyces sp. NPDC002896]|uniref:cupin domain-containing protein n=1 Tax=Streptomyces sp. NPDC002896 TaxID=3154438 RepID=UPI003318490B